MNPFSNDCEIIADSIGSNGIRITTMVVALPRCIWPEFLTHRVFSRNSQSSRAIPVQKVYDSVLNNPYVPIHWGANQRGMQAFEEVDEEVITQAHKLWLEARDNALQSAKSLNDLGLHKQVVNRLLEPFQWHRALVTSTQWENFLVLRDHKDAEPNIRALAIRMREELSRSEPVQRSFHLPFTDHFDQRSVEKFPLDFSMLSAAKCARISYLTFDGRHDWRQDLELSKKLLTTPLHASALEHQATVHEKTILGEAGNLHVPWVDHGQQWHQFRKRFSHENAQENDSRDMAIWTGDKVMLLNDFMEMVEENLYNVLGNDA